MIDVVDEFRSERWRDYYLITMIVHHSYRPWEEVMISVGGG